MIKNMNTNHKTKYDSPTVTVVEMKQEGVVCASPGQAGITNYVWNNNIPEE